MPPKKATKSNDDYKSMTVVELKKLIAKEGIKISKGTGKNGGIVKDDYVKALSKASKKEQWTEKEVTKKLYTDPTLAKDVAAALNKANIKKKSPPKKKSSTTKEPQRESLDDKVLPYRWAYFGRSNYIDFVKPKNDDIERHYQKYLSDEKLYKYASNVGMGKDIVNFRDMSIKFGLSGQSAEIQRFPESLGKKKSSTTNKSKKVY